MTDREDLLQGIAIGDILRARTKNDGPIYICLTMQISDDAIFARRITTQSVHWFDRATGVEIDDDRVIIDSIAPLPDYLRMTMLSIDRKFREAEYRRAEEPDWKPAEDYFHLTDEQHHALDFTDDFYSAHPLPPA